VPSGERASNEGDRRRRNGRCVSERAGIAGVPDQLALKRHRDLEGRERSPWTRRALLVFMQLQVNPANLGRHSHDVELHDGERLLARIDRTLTVFP
jgi:hypothetical protein